MATGNVFSIPPGADFLKVLVEALCEGRLIPGFGYDPVDPLGLASVTIYVPTRRSARALRSEFVDLLGGRSAILPVVRPLGEVDEDAGYFDEDSAEGLELLPPIAPVVRLVELGRLILAWRNMLPAKLREIHKDSPLAAPASPADALWLAKSLTELIDAVETEGASWEGLESIRLEEQALWWQLTGEFLRVAREFWPARLAEMHRSSPILYRNERILGEARRLLANGSPGPVIVAGSTGSIPATAALIHAIQQLPNGAVVLPGLDTTMSERDWVLAGALGADGSRNNDPASRSHPQYNLFHLLARLGWPRELVTPLGSEADDLAIRTRTLSQAFLPTDAEIDHRRWRLEVGDEALGEAFESLAIIEAANEREEALAIAIALKLALHEDPDGECQVALVTPDRNLARRVCSELKRFGIEADDSSGTPLASSHHGSLVRLVLESVLRPGDPVTLASLIKHPLVRLGRSRSDLLTEAELLELLCLRGGTALADPAHLSTVAEDAFRTLEPRKFWQKPLTDPDCHAAVAALARSVEAAVEPLSRLLAREEEERVRPRFSLSTWAEATGQVLEALCCDENQRLDSLWSGEAGDALAGLIRDLMETGDVMEASGPEWADCVIALLGDIGIRPSAMGHPRVFIWGVLEARLQRVDTLVLGGLNEGLWPGQTASNPFLSRLMKTEIGLEPPERRIGQAAHDFAMSMGTRKLVLTRSLRSGGAPSVASRFLQRLGSVVGDELMASMVRRGQRFLDYAEAVDAGARQEFETRPEPKPDSRLQPDGYSFSEAGRLRRDPYAIYARRILKLDPLDPFNEDPGAADRGNIYHAIVERYIRDGHDPRSPDAERTIDAITENVFRETRLPLHIEAIWKPRFLDTARAFLAFEQERRPLIKESLVERTARVVLPESGLVLRGRADRIDIRKDGLADIVDYKTGTSPSMKEARSLLDPQLALEAAALKLAGFEGVKAMESQDLLYIRLRPEPGFKGECVNNENAARTKPEDRKTAMDLAENALRQLINLAAALKTGKAGFKSRVAPFKDRDYGGEYDHLARVAEWSAEQSGEEGEDV